MRCSNLGKNKDFILIFLKTTLVEKRNCRLRPGSAASQGDDLAREVRLDNCPKFSYSIFVEKLNKKIYLLYNIQMILILVKHLLTNNE